MMLIWLLVILCVSQTRGGPQWDTEKRQFPKEFRFGTATSAYQVEGAWNTDGKGESILDHYYHARTTQVADGTTGDVAANSYHNVQRDVEMMRQMGTDFYRFSMSWSRILPTGLNDVINEKGLEYYDKLLTELIKYKIEPMVTMYHYDLPQPLQEMGGWTNPMIVTWFLDYAAVLFDRFATRVKYWITVNNPAICFDMYSGKFPPALHSEGVGDYICAKHMLLAHAMTYKLFNESYRAKDRQVIGLVGMATNINWADPKDFDGTQHDDAAELYRNFSFGMFIHPIWGEKGGWPKLLKDMVAKKSKAEGYAASRLPEFTKEETELLMKSADFLGMNHYTSHFVEFPSSHTAPSLPHPYGDIAVVLSQGEGWAQSKSHWKGAPYGLYKACVYLKQAYDHPAIIVTEHGWPSDTGIADEDRVENMREYMKAALFSMEDGVNLRGLTYWSLMDSFQWNAGFTERFGLFEVDFKSPAKTRTPRQSAVFLRDVIDTKKLSDFWVPSSLHLNISLRRLQEKKQNEEL